MADPFPSRRNRLHIPGHEVKRARGLNEAVRYTAQSDFILFVCIPDFMDLLDSDVPHRLPLQSLREKPLHRDASASIFEYGFHVPR